MPKGYEIAGLAEMSDQVAGRRLSLLAESSIKHIWEVDYELQGRNRIWGENFRKRNQERLEYALKELRRRNLPLSFADDLIRKVPKRKRKPATRD